MALTRSRLPCFAAAIRLSRSFIETLPNVSETSGIDSSHIPQRFQIQCDGVGAIWPQDGGRSGITRHLATRQDPICEIRGKVLRGSSANPFGGLGLGPTLH